jgi:AraC-like DNA-binding protein
MSASKFGQISSFPRNLTEILKAVTNTTLGVVMSRTSRSQAERALYETSMEPGQRLASGLGVLKTRELPKTMKHETASDTLEKHYSINEISHLWGLSQKTVRRIFEHEPGVIELANHKSRNKRTYVTRRIPESVLERVHRKLQKPA